MNEGRFTLLLRNMKALFATPFIDGAGMIATVASTACVVLLILSILRGRIPNRDGS